MDNLWCQRDARAAVVSEKAKLVFQECVAIVKCLRQHWNHEFPPPPGGKSTTLSDGELSGVLVEIISDKYAQENLCWRIVPGSPFFKRKYGIFWDPDLTEKKNRDLSGSGSQLSHPEKNRIFFSIAFVRAHVSAPYHTIDHTRLLQKMKIVKYGIFSDPDLMGKRVRDLFGSGCRHRKKYGIFLDLDLVTEKNLGFFGIWISS